MAINWDELDDVLLPEQAAKIIRMDLGLLRREIQLIRRGTSKSNFPAITFGTRKTIIPRDALREWLTKGGRL